MLNNPYQKDAKIFFFLVALFTIGAIFLFLFFALGQDRRITSYTECIQSRASKILEIYPSVCITAGGKRFIEPIDGTENRRVPPLPPEEKAQDEFSVASTSARTYLAPGDQFSIILPAGWIVRQTETTAKIDRENIQALEIVKEEESRAYPIGRIVMDYTTPGTDFALKAWRNNFVPAAVPFGPYPTLFGGMNFSMIESSESGGFTDGFSTDSYFGLNKEKKIALGIFSHYQSEEEQAEKKKILSTFKFLP